MMKTCSLGYNEIILLPHYYSCSSFLTLILLSCKRILRRDILASQANAYVSSILSMRFLVFAVSEMTKFRQKLYRQVLYLPPKSRSNIKYFFTFIDLVFILEQKRVVQTCSVDEENNSQKKMLKMYRKLESGNQIEHSTHHHLELLRKYKQTIDTMSLSQL